MKRTKFTEKQIIGLLKEARPADLARRYGVLEATIYNCKSQYGRLEVSEAQRLKDLESETGKLKRLLAHAIRDQAALKKFLAKEGFDARHEVGRCRACPRVP